MKQSEKEEKMSERVREKETKTFCKAYYLKYMVILLHFAYNWSTYLGNLWSRLWNTTKTDISHFLHIGSHWLPCSISYEAKTTAKNYKENFSDKLFPFIIFEDPAFHHQPIFMSVFMKWFQVFWSKQKKKEKQKSDWLSNE